MAQPLFEEHPLEDYFRESGEEVDIMPGGDLNFATEVTEHSPAYLHRYRFFSIVVRLIQLVRSRSHTSQHTNAFAERFKYNVISSSLLSSTVSTIHSAHHHRSFSPHIPGKLISNTDCATSLSEPSHAPPILDSFTDSHWPLTLSCMAAVAFVTGSLVLFLLLASTTLVFFHISNIDKSVSPEIVSASFDALDELTAAGNVWDSAVNEAITILENEERSIFYGPTSAASPSTTLRVALQSSLHTTQNQCDNVRQLLTALTSPSELAPLSEMYSPPSPVKTPTNQETIRPKSFPDIRQRTMSAPDKRATWNGSYAALAQAGSPNMQIFKRREKRRSDLSVLLDSRGGTVKSAPVTPPSSSLRGVVEEAFEFEKQPATDPEPVYAGDEDPFGVAALDLRRQHRNSGLETFGLRDDPQQTISSSTRFTLMHTARHPLSLSALNLALQGALAAKRYTCSHLLALRFDDEDEYWEDVRSVIALLTSTLVDASSRLMEALDEAEKKRMKDEVPSSASVSRATSAEPPSPLCSMSHLRSSSWSSVSKEKRRFRTVEQMISFAPMPSNLARFVAHVDALSSALNDARDNLEQCMASLRENGVTNAASKSELAYLKSPSQHPTLESYDRLRKELGLALRECERGREHLLEVVHAGRKRDVEEPEDENGDEDDVPALGHDTGTDESEDRLPESLSAPSQITSFVAASEGARAGQDEIYPDDVTAHLLATASIQHLPPVGVEQVFEAETLPDSEANFTRERSKLSREERIAQSKALREKRQSTQFHYFHSTEGSEEGVRVERARRGGLGPGGEVVQELKDVIWKVGERRRKMAEQLLLRSTSSSEESPPRRIPSPFTRLDSS